MRERSRIRRSESSQLVKPADKPSFDPPLGLHTGAQVGHAFSQISVLRAPTQVASQQKLTVDTPGDAYEQEADRVSEQVMRTADPLPAETSITQSTSHSTLQAAPAPGSALIV